MPFKKGHKPHNKGHVKVGSHFKAKPKKKWPLLKDIVENPTKELFQSLTKKRLRRNNFVFTLFFIPFYPTR